MYVIEHNFYSVNLLKISLHSDFDDVLYVAIQIRLFQTISVQLAAIHFDRCIHRNVFCYIFEKIKLDMRSLLQIYLLQKNQPNNR